MPYSYELSDDRSIEDYHPICIVSALFPHQRYLILMEAAHLLGNQMQVFSLYMLAISCKHLTK